MFINMFFYLLENSNILDLKLFTVIQSKYNKGAKEKFNFVVDFISKSVKDKLDKTDSILKIKK